MTRARRWLRKGAGFLLVAVFVLGIAGLIRYLTWPTLPMDHSRLVDVYTDGQLTDALADSFPIWVSDAIEALGLPSVQSAISLNGGLAWSGAFGYADVATLRPATLETQYRVGSVAKSLTAMVMARLVSRGLLDMDQPISTLGDSTLAEAFPKKAWPITPRHLATHTAGIRHYRGSLSHFPPHEMYSRRHFGTVSGSVGPFGIDSLLFQPGNGFSYSTYGYVLLSAVLEAASGEEFLDLMRQELFVPLGMSRTQPDVRGDAFVDRAIPSEILGRRIPSTVPVDLSNKWGGGGFLSTASDLVRFGGGLLQGLVVDSVTLNQAFRPQLLVNGQTNPQHYGWGFRIDQEATRLGLSEPVRVVHHGGQSAGGSAFLLLLPDHGIAVALTTNVGVRQAEVLRSVAYRMAGAMYASR